MGTRLVRGAICVFALVMPGKCTTVIYKTEGDRIIIAADNRAVTMVGGRQVVRDNACKVHLIGRTVLAVAGMPSHYHGTVLTPESLDWDVLQDAQRVSQQVDGDTDKLAYAWGSLLAHQIAAYVDLDPKSKADMIGRSERDVLIEGIFANWTSGVPKVTVENVQILEKGIYAYPPANRPPGIEESTNAISQELIRGDTARARAVNRRWMSEAKKYPAGEISWRHIQFLVRETSTYDHTVSPTSDVIEIPPSGQVMWLSRSRCR